MLIIDPFDEFEIDKTPDGIRISVLYQNVFYIFKIFLILISLFIIIFLILVVIVPEKEIIIQPFESNEKYLSSIFITNHLCFELQDIKEINNKKIWSPTFQYDYGPRTPSISLGANSIDYRINELGSVGVGGTSLSLGQLVLSIKQFFHNNAPILTGCIQRSESELRIVAVLSDPREGFKAWEVCKNLAEKDNNITEENIPIMIEDLSFQIVTSLINEQTPYRKNPQTWEAFKYLTMSRKAYNSYNSTGNINDLNRSRDFALKASEFEPSYSEISILFSIIGSSYLKFHKYKESERLFKNATKLNSSNADSWNGLGLTLFCMNRFKDSIQAYNQAIKLNQTNGDFWYNKGLVLDRMRKYNESLQAYDQAIELNSTDADAWNNKGAALIALNRSDDAIEALEGAIRLNPRDPYAWDNIGMVLYGMGEYNESIQAFDNATALNDSYKEAWYNKGLSLALVGRYNDSLRAFNTVIQIDPNDADAWYSKNEVLKSCRRFAEANATFAKAKELGYKG